MTLESNVNIKTSSSKSEAVTVIVRCRPLNEKEVENGHESIVNVFPERGAVELKNPHPNSHEEPLRQFTFDAVYDCNSKQQDLYDESFRPLVQSVLQGFNGTIFAYGQTGTGKTYTMQGIPSHVDEKGVIPRTFEQIFDHISFSTDQQYLVRASYLEIYMEEVRDLLQKDQAKRLDLKESPDTGVYVKDLSSFVCKSVKEIEHVMTVGNKNRAVGATNMNEHSTRSHVIFLITVECSELGCDNENHIRVGKLNLVDLAGSERQAKTGAVGERFKEATKINLSLAALGNVISALTGKGTHVPYRDSKLTRLLQDSLGGNAKTVMVANIGPAAYNYDETLGTLRYANRAKSIKNKPRINEDPKDALLREFQEEISRLKTALANRGGKKHKKKKTTEKGPRDENENDEECSEEGEADEEQVSLNWKEQQEELDRERSAILNDKNIIAEEKERLLNEVQRKAQQLQEERRAQEKLAKKIEALQSKLLSGGTNIVDHTNEQQKALEQRKLEIAEQKKREREMRQQLESKEETALQLKETFTSLKQEVEVKTKQLKKLAAKLISHKQELADTREEFVKERAELTLMQNNLTKDLKKKYLILENFIPSEEREKLQSRCFYDEEADKWSLLPPKQKSEVRILSKRPISAVGARRPISEYARMQITRNGSAIRYRGENIVMLPLEVIGRTTRDYVSPRVSPYVQAALDAALKGEGDLDIDASASRLLSRSAIHGILKERTRGSQHHLRVISKKPGASRGDSPKENYPKSRGLVPK